MLRSSEEHFFFIIPNMNLGCKMPILSYNISYEKIGDKVVPLEVPFDISDSWEWVRLGSLL